MVTRKRKIVLALGAVLLVPVLAFGAMVGIANWLEGQDTYYMRVSRVESSSYDLALNESKVQTELPGFHRLLETAARDGLAVTEDAILIEQIWQYLDRASGEQERGPTILYRGNVFATSHGTQ